MFKLLSSMLVKAISGLPSVSTSAMLICRLIKVVGWISLSKAKFPDVLVLFRMVIDFRVVEAIPISGLPSPSRSPKSIPQGATSVAKVLKLSKVMVLVL